MRLRQLLNGQTDETEKAADEAALVGQPRIYDGTGAVCRSGCD
jgi:hypothetical protein